MSRHLCETFIEVLRERAMHQPNQEGYCFLYDGETQFHRLSYGELDQQARAIAAVLQHLKLQGERALLLYPPGLDYIVAFFGCLYAGVIAVPAYPPRPNQTLNRLASLASDAQAQIVLTTHARLAELQQQTQFSVAAQHWIATDTVAAALAADWQPLRFSSDTLAFLQYTSGSTGQPKGVQISHGNLLHNSALIHQRFGHSPASRGVIWLPPYHDMGLIGGILQPLYGGFPVVLMSPVAFLQKPIRWLQTISRYQGTTSGAPTFAYQRCLEKVSAQQRAELDLSCWDVAFVGAEPIRADTLRQFAAAFAPCGFRPEAFYPCYGLAEATLFVAGAAKGKGAKPIALSKAALQQHRVEIFPSQDSAPESPSESATPDPASVQTMISSGRLDLDVIIVDPETRRLCAPEEIGEIWLAGDSVAQGYWQQPELTRQTFQARLSNPLSDPPKAYLRTGDLGFLHQDELYITGRLKDIIIIRGQNHYPQDIEQTSEQSYPDLVGGTAAAFSIERDQTEQLVLVQEVARERWRSINADTAIEAIRAALSQHHQLQADAVVLVKPGSIPKTSSGKVQRHICREKFCDGNLDVIRQWQFNQSLPFDSNQNNVNGNEKGDDPAQPAAQPSDHPLVDSRVDHLIAWLRDYATHHINSRLMDERRSIAPHVVLDFGNQGLLGLQVAAEFGGLALGHCSTMRILEQLGAIDPTLALFVGLNNVLGIRPIACYGTPVLQAELLPLLATGRELAAFALTESGAGSNPQAIQSQAIPQGDSWLLTGRKIWSGSAAWAGVINVFVRHHDRQGISGFAIRRGTPGLRQGPEALTMGMRGMVQNTVYLEQVPVQRRELLGDVGAGMSVAQDAMMYGRLAIAAASLGGMKRCAQLMLRYSQRRTIATGRLLDNPVTRIRLSHLTAAITAIEALVSQIAHQLDAGQTVPPEAYTVCKIAAPEFYWQAADWLVQTLGGRGYIETNLAPQILRDARVLRIFEGPTETLTLFLGSRVIHQPQSLHTWLSQALNAPKIAQALVAATTQIRDRPLVSDPMTATRWAAAQMGELATLAVLQAALEFAFKSQPASAKRFQQAIAWIQQQFERKMEQTLSDAAEIATAESLTHVITDYSESVGDIEQQLAGEENQIDELLRAESLTQSPLVSALDEQSDSTELSVELAENTVPSSGADSPGIDCSQSEPPSQTIIQSWLIHWLSQKLQIPANTLDCHKAFADYGIDSVLAVELAQDLETWLHLPQPLEATIAWNFPTIAALASYLAAPSSPPTIPPSSTLSDTELAQLLTAEIAAARRSRQ
ncbi:MAG: AMP-binding protein [Synechococcales cyanobacterium M58_A2018_015]|nr:AMP-binding protein [Synechococcales cyanobacterium M58_A2018_015]